MKQENKGFSLVELIVVIAIMTILTGLISAGIGMAVSKPADECIDKLKASLQSIRVTSMGKFDAHIEIYKKGDQIYAKEYYTEDSSGRETTKNKSTYTQQHSDPSYYTTNNTRQEIFDSTNTTVKRKRSFEHNL